MWLLCIYAWLLLSHDSFVTRVKATQCHLVPHSDSGLADKLPKHDIDPSVYLDRTMTANSFMFRGICPTEVYDEIMSLKVDKSALDIPRKCIKHAVNHIYEALSMGFNQSLLQGIFPENFKVSKVTPIDKGGEEMDPFNYRPISTLSALSQIFEKLICKQLVN